MLGENSLENSEKINENSKCSGAAVHVQRRSKYAISKQLIRIFFAKGADKKQLRGRMSRQSSLRKGESERPERGREGELPTALSFS